MFNIFDIAKRAGVSKTTVSRVINNQPGVSEDTRQKVLKAIEELNYVPNQAARSLVSRKSGTIGVIYNEFNTSIYLQLANLLQKYAEQFNYNIVFCSSNDDLNTKTKYVQYFTGGAADGLIMFGSDIKDKELVQKVLNSNFPLVLIENSFSDLIVNDILIDNFSAGKKAVEYLISLGHKQIAHITGNLSHRAASDRMNGYIEALNEAGIKYNEDYVVCTDAGENTGAMAIEKLIYLKHPPTAIFAFNDLQGYEAIRRANELGIMIPDDISIVGVDNMIEVLRFIPSKIRLTSMHQPMDKVAEAAIRLIIEKLENEAAEPKIITFETEIFEGTSCCRHLAECE